MTIYIMVAQKQHTQATVLITMDVPLILVLTANIVQFILKIYTETMLLLQIKRN